MTFAMLLIEVVLFFFGAGLRSQCPSHPVETPPSAVGFPKDIFIRDGALELQMCDAASNVIDCQLIQFPHGRVIIARDVRAKKRVAIKIMTVASSDPWNWSKGKLYMSMRNWRLNNMAIGMQKTNENRLFLLCKVSKQIAQRSFCNHGPIFRHFINKINLKKNQFSRLFIFKRANVWRTVVPNELTRCVSLPGKLPARNVQFVGPQPAFVEHSYFHVHGFKSGAKSGKKITVSTHFLFPAQFGFVVFKRNHDCDEAVQCRIVGIVDLNGCDRANVMDIIGGQWPIVSDLKPLVKRVRLVVRDGWINGYFLSGGEHAIDNRQHGSKESHKC